MEMAKIAAKRSLCSRAQVGALITDTTGRIVQSGYNGPPAGYRHGSQPCNIWCKRASGPTPSPDYTDCVTLHAEANALMWSDRSLRQGGTIYITSHVCWGCAKLIANSGLSRVVVHAERPDLHRDPMASYTFLMECGVDVEVNDQVMMTRLKPSNFWNVGWTLPPHKVYLTEDDRTSRNPSPSKGEMSWITNGDRFDIFDGEQWVPLVPVPSYHPERLVD